MAGLALIIFFSVVIFCFVLFFNALIQWVAALMMGSQVGYFTAVKVQLVAWIALAIVFLPIFLFSGMSLAMSPLLLLIGLFVYLVFMFRYMMQAYGLGFLRVVGVLLLIMFFNAGLGLLSEWGLSEAGYSEYEIRRMMDNGNFFK